ncbi:hypothetical protein GGS26DRAFT_595689 [Hypomontagnella submonticulosa]|nr:hypothetical protein GGS26DRAFT_595689 [Hypomontagnella submonticulosa]
MVKDPEEALKRRRERGRRSQAGFRKRQAEANQLMQEQNRRLKSAIEKLVNTARGDERQELLTAISDVAKAADTDVKTLTFECQPKPVCGNCHNIPQGEDLVIDSERRDVFCGWDHATDTRRAPPPLPSASLPRLKCGLWISDIYYMQITIPPDDILPYIGDGAKTFAGIIFWSMMDHSQGKCERKHTDINTLIKKSLGHSKITDDWTIRYILAMVEGRQEYKGKGFISARYASAVDQDLGMVVRDRVQDDYRARGMDPNKWLSATGIERHVRSFLGDDTFGVLDTAARGEGDFDLRHWFEDIQCKLCETCVCFGDGPRWHVDIVDELFLGWVHSAFWYT